MDGRYTSFLIRHWYRPDGARRIVVEEVQSGERVVVDSLNAAAAWLGARVPPAPVAPEGTAERGDAPPPGAD